MSSSPESRFMESANMSKPPVHKKARSPKPSARSKRANVHEHGVSGIMDGRHKRVWKACERCRMKKTKCDGESPCKRCKDDGLVCTAGSRKKTEFKQLPKGYAEVLEHTQYALIGTVQKLYAMVRAGESWTYDEPALNDRGLPVIHNIAEILGCIRQAPDLPYVFPENEEGFQELERKLASSDFNSPPSTTTNVKSELGSRKLSDDSAVDMHDLPDAMDTPHIDTASSSDDHEEPDEPDYSAMLWAQQQAAAQAARLPLSTPYSPTTLLDMQNAQSQQSMMSQVYPSHRHSASTFSFASVDAVSPIYSNISSPILRTDSPFKTTWYNTATNGPDVADDFLGTTHPLDITASYVQRQTQLRREQRYSDSFLQAPAIPRSEGMCGDGTIRPGMLDCHTGITQGLDGLGFDCDVSGMWES